MTGSTCVPAVLPSGRQAARSLLPAALLRELRRDSALVEAVGAPHSFFLHCFFQLQAPFQFCFCTMLVQRHASSILLYLCRLVAAGALDHHDLAVSSCGVASASRSFNVAVVLLGA